jgi:hypothetical protein
MVRHILLRRSPERSAEHYDYLALVHGMQPLEGHTPTSILLRTIAREDLNEMTDVIDGIPRLDEYTARLNKSRNVSCVFAVQVLLIFKSYRHLQID